MVEIRDHSSDKAVVQPFEQCGRVLVPSTDAITLYLTLAEFENSIRYLLVAEIHEPM